MSSLLKKENWGRQWQLVYRVLSLQKKSEQQIKNAWKSLDAATNTDRVVGGARELTSSALILHFESTHIDLTLQPEVIISKKKCNFV